MTTSERAKKRHDALAAELRAHDYRYYVLDDPTLSDREYDTLYAELRALESQYPELKTARLADPASGRRAKRSDLRTVHRTPSRR